MLPFLLAASALVAITLWILGPVLFTIKELKQVDLEQENLAIAKQRLAELTTDQEQDPENQLELEATLLDDLKGPDYNLSGNHSVGIRSGISVIIGIPVAAIVLYSLLGNTQWNSIRLNNNQEIVTATPQSENQSQSAASLDTLIVKLEQNLLENPDNADGWALAGRTYMSLGQFDKAEQAYARLNQLILDDPSVLTAWADASLMVNGNVYTDEIAERIQRALTLDPQQGNALWIAGIGLMSIGEHEAALASLNRLLPLIENDSEATRQVNSIISQIRSLQDSPVTSSVAEAGASNTAPTEMASTENESSSVETAEANPAITSGVIHVSVTLDAGLKDSLTGSETVFVFARAPNGPPFPLAVARLTVKDLPLQLQLDDSMSMMPGKDISSVNQVVVTARVSRSGNPLAQPGDLTSDAVATPTDGSPSVKLAIDKEVE
jgi:cytochrome c-type biogenesis protein CcmH